MKTMEKTFAGLVSFLMVFSGVALAEEVTLQDPGTLPDSSFYPLKRAIERVRLVITFDEDGKAKLHALYAERRLAEMNASLEKGRFEVVQRLRADYENEVNETQKGLALGKNRTALAEHVAAMTYKHRLVLDGLEEKAPEQAKIHIRRAIEASENGHAEAVDNILKERPEVTGNVTVDLMVDGKPVHLVYNISEVRKLGKIVIRERLENKRLERATEQIKDAREEIAEAKEKVEASNVTLAKKLLSEAETHLSRAEQAFRDGKLGEAFGQATAAENLAKNAIRAVEHPEEAAEVEEKIENRTATGKEIREKVRERIENRTE